MSFRWSLEDDVSDRNVDNGRDAQPDDVGSILVPLRQMMQSRSVGHHRRQKGAVRLPEAIVPALRCTMPRRSRIQLPRTSWERAKAPADRLVKERPDRTVRKGPPGVCRLLTPQLRSHAWASVSMMKNSSLKRPLQDAAEPFCHRDPGSIDPLSMAQGAAVDAHQPAGEHAGADPPAPER